PAASSQASYCNTAQGGDMTAPSSGSVTTTGITNCVDGGGNYITTQALYAFVPKQAGGTLPPTTPISSVVGTDTTTLITYPFTHYNTYTRTTSDMVNEVWYLSPFPDISNADAMTVTASWAGAGDLAAVIYVVAVIHIDTAAPIAHAATNENTGTSALTVIASDPTPVVRA